MHAGLIRSHLSFRDRHDTHAKDSVPVLAVGSRGSFPDWRLSPMVSASVSEVRVALDHPLGTVKESNRWPGAPTIQVRDRAACELLMMRKKCPLYAGLI